MGFLTCHLIRVQSLTPYHHCTSLLLKPLNCERWVLCLVKWVMVTALGHLILYVITEGYGSRLSAECFARWWWLCNGVKFVLLQFARTTTEIVVCLDRYGIHRSCWRPFVPLYDIYVFQWYWLQEHSTNVEILHWHIKFNLHWVLNFH